MTGATQASIEPVEAPTDETVLVPVVVGDPPQEQPREAQASAEPARRRSPWTKLAAGFLEAVGAGALIGFVAIVIAPIALGWRPYTVLTGSMRPQIQPGDVVMDRPVRVANVHVGDVVTFSDPTRAGKLVTHRIRSITRGATLTQVETRGDANTTSERWTVHTKDRVGRVVYTIPKVGHLAVAMRTPAGILLALVLPVLGIGFIVLRKIWREDDEDDAAATGDGPQPDEANAAPDR